MPVVEDGGYALVATRVPRRVGSVVLVLHGGAAPGHGVRDTTRRTQLSVVRLLPTARWIAWRTRRRGVAVYRQRNTWRGWDAERGPVDDTRASLDAVVARHGQVPIALVGHSLGGRTALLAAQDDRVSLVVGLNAYVYDSDAPALPGRRVLLVHGDDDRVADIARVRRLAARLREAPGAGPVSLETVPGGTHGMVGHPRAFDGRAAREVADWAARAPGRR